MLEAGVQVFRHSLLALFALVSLVALPLLLASLLGCTLTLDLVRTNGLGGLLRPDDEACHAALDGLALVVGPGQVAHRRRKEDEEGETPVWKGLSRGPCDCPRGALPGTGRWRRRYGDYVDPLLDAELDAQAIDSSTGYPQ